MDSHYLLKQKKWTPVTPSMAYDDDIYNILFRWNIHVNDNRWSLKMGKHMASLSVLTSLYFFLSNENQAN